ncbi:MAG: DUF2255 family protein [Thermoleophilaceae bacterium]
MEWPGRLETVEEVDIETRRSGDAPVHRTVIWAVVTDGIVYVRSLRGEDGRWFRELMANPDAVLHVEGEAVPVRGVRADDADSVERATDGFRRKYGDSPYLDTMIRDEIAPTTVRLAPR